MIRTSHAIILLLTGLLAGCLSVQSLRHTDPHILHHHNWWNYYQRGRLYLREEQFELARNDFQTALGLIPGARYPYAKDCWRARTYGMHMQEAYFPHRELGISLFELGELQQALRLLETSIQMEPSARAKFYINLIHQQLAASAKPPEIETESLPIWTAKRTYPVQGTVSGVNRIASISVNGQPEFIELAQTRFDFTHNIELQEGPNRIHIAAEDLNRLRMETNLTLHADWTPPQIHLNRNNDGIQVICTDNLALERLQINEQTLFATNNQLTVDCPLNPDQSLSLSALDRAGNRIDWTLSSKELLHLSKAAQAAEPKLHLTDAGRTLTLHRAEYALDVRAEDDTALRTVTLNGQNLLSQASPLLRTLKRVPLTIGTNCFTLAAEDFDGNRTEEQITIIYQPPQYLDRIYRLTTSQTPLDGEIPDTLFGQRITRLMGHELTRDPVRFFLLAEPDEAKDLMKERELADSAWADPRIELDRTKLLNADLLFITRVLSDGAGQTVYTRVLDAETGKELFIEDVYTEDSDDLPNRIGGLVMKLEQRFPLIQAGIKQGTGGLMISAGSHQGACKGMRFLVIRSPGEMENGRIVLADQHPLEVRLSSVEPSTAEIIIPHEGHDVSIYPGDYVFSR